MPILHKLLQKGEEKGTFLNPLYEARITDTKARKETIRKINYKTVFFMYKDFKLDIKFLNS